MFRKIANPAVVALLATVFLITGCSTTPTPPTGTPSAHTYAVTEGTMDELGNPTQTGDTTAYNGNGFTYIVTYGSSTCPLKLVNARLLLNEADQILEVTAEDPNRGACTSDLVPHVNKIKTGTVEPTIVNITNTDGAEVSYPVHPLPTTS